MKLMNALFAAGFLALASMASAATVADVKAAADNTVLTNVTGVVTSVGGSTARNQFTIQDSTSGLLIDRGSLAAGSYTIPAVGDNVTILNGTKVTAFGTTVQFAPVAGSDVVINSNSNPLPAPTVYTPAAFLAAPTLEIQGLYIRLTNVQFLNAPVGVWGAGGGRNFNTSNGTETVVVRLVSDLGQDAAVWTTKTAPVNSVDNVDIIGVGSIFGANQMYISTPAGTSAKTDATGPIAPATITNVSDWSIY